MIGSRKRPEVGYRRPPVVCFNEMPTQKFKLIFADSCCEVGKKEIFACNNSTRKHCSKNRFLRLIVFLSKFKNQSTLSSREAGPEGGSGTLNFVVAFLVFPAGCIFVFPIFILGEFVEFHVFLPFFSYELACSEGNRMATHYRRLVW